MSATVADGGGGGSSNGNNSGRSSSNSSGSTSGDDVTVRKGKAAGKISIEGGDGTPATSHATSSRSVGGVPDRSIDRIGGPGDSDSDSDDDDETVRKPRRLSPSSSSSSSSDQDETIRAPRVVAAASASTGRSSAGTLTPRTPRSLKDVNLVVEVPAARVVASSATDPIHVSHDKVGTVAAVTYEGMSCLTIAHPAAMLRDEIERLAGVRHPHVASLFGVITDGPNPAPTTTTTTTLLFAARSTRSLTSLLLDETVAYETVGTI